MNKFYFTWSLLLLTMVSGVAQIQNRNEVALSLATVQEMLSKELTREEVEAKLGKPIVRPEGNWGNLMYRTPENKYVFFWFKGPYIYGAEYGDVEVKGVQPRTYKMNVDFDPSQQKYFFYLDNEAFGEFESFKNRLKKLPQKSIVEWQHSDDLSFTKEPSPLSNGKQLEEFEAFSKKLGIILIQYPGG